MILGLENNGIFDYSPDYIFKQGRHMRSNTPWQSKILLLREKMKEHSQWLLDNIIKKGEEPASWWWRVLANTDEERQALSDDFVCPDMELWEYFASSFVEMRIINSSI